MDGIVILHFAYLGLLLPAAIFAGFCWWRSKGERKPIVLIAQLLVAVTTILGFAGILRQTVVELSKPNTLVAISDLSDSMSGRDPLQEIKADAAFTFAGEASRVDGDQRAPTATDRKPE